MTNSREQMLHRQEVLAEFGEFALQCDDLDEVLGKACALVAAALGTTRAKILEIEPGGKGLFMRAGIGWPGDLMGYLRLPMSEQSSETYAIALGEPVVTQDIATETRFSIPEFMRQAGVVALVNVPIMLPQREPFGLLQVDATEPREFGAKEIQFLRTYSIILGPVIDRLRNLSELASTRERFELIVSNALDYAILLTDTEDRIAEWLPGAEAVFGWSREEAIGQPGSILFTQEDLENGIDRAELAVARERGEAPDVRWHVNKSGRRVFIDGTVKPLRDASGKATGFIKIGQDVTDQRLLQERQRLLIEGVPQLVWRAEGLGQWTWSSPQWSAFTGQGQEQSSALGWLETVHPEDRDATMAAWRSAAAGGLLEVEHRIHHREEDRYRWFQTRALPVRQGGSGRIQEWLGTSTDVDDLRRLQDEQQVMVAELQHRTRNLIAVVQSIARQTANGTSSMPDFQQRFADRLAALSRVQGLLSRSDTRPIEIGDLVRMELEAMGAEIGTRVAIGGPAVVLPNTVVQTLALVLHELATNARKYGALFVPAGQLRVSWSLADNHAGTPRLLLEWREDELEPVREASSPTTSGYGRELIEHALPYSLGAKTSYTLAGTSLLCTIEVPLRRRTGLGRSHG